MFLSSVTLAPGTAFSPGPWSAAIGDWGLRPKASVNGYQLSVFGYQRRGRDGVALRNEAVLHKVDNSDYANKLASLV